MANPPSLPPATSGAPGGPNPSEWENWFGGLLHGINPGGAFDHGPGVPQSPRSKSPEATGHPDARQAPGTPSPLSGDFWQRLLLDVEVYGFLILLAGVGLYGLFAPQVNTVVQTAAATAAPGANAKAIGRRIGNKLRRTKPKTP